ncbi:Chondroitin polymerase [uncultured Roseburia sp.]|uniref:Glycosyltransferase n=1 Tax=Brotonthovivens ammoniilytica TaxID=2981725 RepID=A0ABT2TME4_9FIRM|nr:glycosyltransferase family 2 protein [Brotonthovivens ammoniilytica]MCU6762674.1 glycosyltransferase [Brotonthovivens ammoniilytica]SCI84306.1 Chondroitin polymerase [uncultured Roseburia sp.]
MDNPKISVILPVYNVEDYLAQCMDSIVNQTLKEIEIICIDDGSQDRSLEILKNYEKKDSRVSVITQENAGAGAARNNGLKRAKGEYLSFLDSDDFFEPEMLEKAYKQAKNDRAQIAVFRSDQFREDLNQFVKVNWTLRMEHLPCYQPMYHRTFTGNIFKVFVGWAWDKIFETQFVKDHELWFQEQRTSNDMLFVFSAVVLAKRITVIDEILAHQRRNNPNSLSNTREKSWQCFYEALKALKANLIDYGVYWEVKQDYINYALHFSLWNLETLNGAKKEVLYNQLKNEWFSDLEISGKPEEYFYNKKEFEKYKKINELDFKEYFGS